MKYEEILSAGKNWYYAMKQKYNDRLIFEIDIDNSDEFVANIDTDLFFGEIYIDNISDNYVEFNIIPICPDGRNFGFCYGDARRDSVQVIIENLNAGIKFLLEEN